MNLACEFEPETAVEFEVERVAGFEVGEAVFEVALEGWGVNFMSVTFEKV